MPPPYSFYGGGIEWDRVGRRREVRGILMAGEESGVYYCYYTLVRSFWLLNLLLDSFNRRFCG
jgi:hypothetical protein